MSREFTANMSLRYLPSILDDPIVFQIVDLITNQTTKVYNSGQKVIGTSEEAIPLGEVTSLGWFWARNLDETNFIQIRTGTGGTAFCKLLPGEACLLPLGSGITAPYAIADTAECNMQFAVFSR